jgi:hypothetical protein
MPCRVNCYRTNKSKTCKPTVGARALCSFVQFVKSKLDLADCIHIGAFDGFTLLWKINVPTVTDYYFFYCCEQLCCILIHSILLLGTITQLRCNNSMASRREEVWVTKGGRDFLQEQGWQCSQPSIFSDFRYISLTVHGRVIAGVGHYIL